MTHLKITKRKRSLTSPPPKRPPRWETLIEFAGKHHIKLSPTQAKTILHREKTLKNSRDFIKSLVRAQQNKLNV